ncbi:hypothetical protein CGMCC3_g15719 [Colletotrichum fructicola]|nr:uncharacterized protein CGMCC3_g15719 [Colletotrichum fructicola]KAE9568163.1 hypothetical protein CGMCC3_g15719 [Colletotrichum fructicola]
MNPARRQLVTRGLWRLPSTSTALRATFVPAVQRYSSSPRKPVLPVPSKPYDENAPLEQHTVSIFRRLNMRSPFQRGIWKEVPRYHSKNIDAQKYILCRYSLEHVVERFDMFKFQNSRHPTANVAVLEYQYEKMKRDRPLWPQYDGVYKFGRAGLVITARARLMKALRTSLFARGYDIYGRRLVAEEVAGQCKKGSGDLRGSILLKAQQPQEIRAKLTMKEIQEVVDYCVDFFIKQTQGAWPPERPPPSAATSRRASRREMQLPPPSLRGLPYQPWLKKEDMLTQGTDSKSSQPLSNVTQVQQESSASKARILPKKAARTLRP